MPLTTAADLSAWRTRLGWSLPQAAAELRLQTASLRNLEAGRKVASPGLLRLAELLEHQHAAPTQAPAPPKRTRAKRIPKPVPTITYSDPLAAAVAVPRIGLPMLSTEGLDLLRTEVERLHAGGTRGYDGNPGAGEDIDAWRDRQEAWRAASGSKAPLTKIAALLLAATAVKCG